MQLVLNNQFRRQKRSDVNHRGCWQRSRFIMASVFRSNRNITIAAALSVHSTKKSIRIHIPRQASKFINGRQNNSRTLGIYFFIDKVNRNWYPIIFVSVELAIPIRAKNLDGLLVSINAKVLLFERLSAERASKELLIDMVSCASCRLRIISLFNKLIKLVRRYSASYPKAYADRFFAKLRVCLPPDHFCRKHHFCNTVSLLCGK